MRAANQSYFPALDGLRAIAVLLVATFHIEGAHTFAALHGGVGVVIFFVLSGFLITSLLIEEERRNGVVNLRAFYIRRTFRIFPAYYIVLALYFVLIVVLRVDHRRGEFMEAFPYYLTYLQEIPHFLFSSRTGGAPFRLSWSLGIEEKFYLLFPVLVFILTRSTRTRVIGIVFVACVCTMMNLWIPWGLLFAPYAFILYGCLLAFARRERPRAFELLTNGWISTGALVACLLLAGRWNNVFAGLAAIAVLPGLLTPTQGLPRVLESRPLAWLGRVSYGFYLLHQLGLNAARKLLPAETTHWNDIAILVIGCTLTIAAAWMLHVSVEKPMIATGRRIGRRLRERRSASDVAKVGT